MLLMTGAALTTFQNALTVNDSAAQLGDANQNLRAGTNQMIRDLMQAGPHHRPGRHSDADRRRACRVHQARRRRSRP